MFKHASHMWICGAMVLGALVVMLATGSATVLVPALGCVLMMLVMVLHHVGRLAGAEEPDR